MTIPQKVSEAAKPEEKKYSYYSVQLEIETPVTLSYRVLATSPQEALAIVEKSPFKAQDRPPQIIWSKLRKIAGKVYTAGTIMLIHSKGWK